METNWIYKNMKSTKNIFITGITGFVGQNISSCLSKNFGVKGISREETDSEITYETYFDEKLPYDAIIHLAGKAHDLKKSANDAEYFEVNYELTKKLYDRFLASDAKQFIYMSSVKAAADAIEGTLTEEAVANPKTPYGKSKRMAEEYILANLPADKKVFILRPCMIHGPGNKGNLNLLFNMVRRGFPWPLAAFENQRSFLSIGNLCFIIHELLENTAILSGIYHLSDDEPVSTKKVIELMGVSQNRKAKMLAIPKSVVVFFAKVGSMLHLPLNSEHLKKLTESYLVSNKKIVSAIGKPLPVSSKEGLLRTFDSFSPSTTLRVTA